MVRSRFCRKRWQKQACSLKHDQRFLISQQAGIAAMRGNELLTSFVLGGLHVEIGPIGPIGPIYQAFADRQRGESLDRGPAAPAMEP